MAYTDKQKKILFDKICERIAEGESLKSILTEKDMPSRPTFYAWIKDNEELINNYARATTARADVIFDQMFEIADKQEKDVKIVDGVPVIDHNVIQRNRLQIDTRKWALSKMNPKKYGEKLDVTSGDKPITPQETTVTFINAKRNKEDK